MTRLEELLDGYEKALRNDWGYERQANTSPTDAIKAARCVRAKRKAIVDLFEEGTLTERQLRREWWLTHGCEVATLYGDDGEMSCGYCGIDFKRWPPNSISARLVNIRRAALSTPTENPKK